MKLSRITVPAFAMMIMFSASASAEEDTVPLDQGIVVDTETESPENPVKDDVVGTEDGTATDDGAETDEEVVDEIDPDAVDDEANATDEEEEVVDETGITEGEEELPIDEGEEVDEGKEVEKDAVAPPAKVEKVDPPKVEPLAKTGVSSMVGLGLGVLASLSLVGLFVSRRFKRLA